MKHYSHSDNKKIFLDTKLDKLFKHKKKDLVTHTLI